MTDRWVLSRAGILNVYQYGDETLTFAGGRLLLRGVNGSGKSTAMNMLLPFLLDADTRRIDAAGEQTGVLRSWMLSGRTEQQPVGYLWVEFERGDEHLVFGCGIRANRSTETVGTWWFVTPQRPGIDFSLVESRVPLSVDGLRSVIGPTAVYTKDQRQAYRSEVRSRLFGGADLDQHIRLLHVVRSPRVGDRIDSELTSYLDEALPQLSDAAIDDAAQPLEDLEEHRRSVAALSITAEALDSLAAIYRSYISTDLRRRATEALTLVRSVRERQHAERRARQAVTAAEAELAERRQRVSTLEADIRRSSAELDGLRSRPAYLEGQALEDLRGRVATLASTIASATAAVTDREARCETGQRETDSARTTFETDGATLTATFSDLRGLCETAGVSAGPPDAPALMVHDVDGVSAPSAPLDIDATRVAFSRLTTTIALRRSDVDTVRTALMRVGEAERALRAAESDCSRAETDVEAADAAVGAARDTLNASVTQLAVDLTTWVASAASLFAELGIEPVDFGSGVPAAADLLGKRDAVRSALLGIVQRSLDDLRDVDAAVAARRSREAEELNKFERELEALASMTMPATPVAPWQSDADLPRLAELIDFAATVDDDARLGIEAAMEAAGLLGAQLAPNGLQLATGELVVVAGSPVASPLSDLVVAAIPDGWSNHVDASQVQVLLGSITTDMETDASTAVAIDGSFRVGALHGRHQRDVVEHIGASARMAALERRRTALRHECDQARKVLDATDEELRARRAGIRVAGELQQALPVTRTVDLAEAASQHAVAEHARRLDVLDARRAAVDRCESTHADADDAARRTAATLRLPVTTTGLAEVDGELDQLVAGCREASGHLTTLSRSCAAWSEAAARWRQARLDVTSGRADLEILETEHAPLVMKLATLEDTLGAAYNEIVQAIGVSEMERATASAALPPARAEVEHQLTTAAGVRADADATAKATTETEERCVAQLPRLRAALDTIGVRAALRPTILESDGEGDHAAAETAETAPAVSETSEGLRLLAEFVLSEAPEPSVAASAESVRQSLRQRRDTLGAGWDAEDRQPDESMPLQVEVNGPLGRMPLADASRHVRSQLAHQSSLLTAKQDQALRNLLQGLIAKEVAAKLHAAGTLVDLMNKRLKTVETAHGIGASLRWRRRDELDDGLAETIGLLAKPPGLRDVEEDAALAAALSTRIDDARRADPEAPYRQLIATVLDYRRWHEMSVMLHRPGKNPERLSRRTALSEGEKKMVSYLPLFAAVAASCDALAGSEPAAPRFVLLDDAFAKVSEDNHPKLFGLLVELDLDFIATSERLWGTHSTVPELAITEVIRDADSGVIVLEHARWDGRSRVAAS